MVSFQWDLVNRFPAPEVTKATKEKERKEAEAARRAQAEAERQNKIKNLQKKYIRSGYDSSIKSELDKLNEELFNIPIYKIYLDNLEVVNQKLDYVKDSLNDYFYKLFNE